jgi:hypothetical protein
MWVKNKLAWLLHRNSSNWACFTTPVQSSLFSLALRLGEVTISANLCSATTTRDARLTGPPNQVTGEGEGKHGGGGLHLTPKACPMVLQLM